MNDVIIAGGGPNGLMLACELRLAGVAATVLEKLETPSTEPKANGLVGQVVRVMDHRGLYEPLAGEPGPPVPNSAYFMFAAMGLDLSLLDHSPVYNLAVPQQRIVEVLEERALSLGAEIRRGHELVDFTQDQDGVRAEVAGPRGRYHLSGTYLVGADGAHSPVRKQSGIAFPGVTFDRVTARMAHASVPNDWVDENRVLHVPGFGPVTPFVPCRTDTGSFSFAPFPGKPTLLSTSEWDQPEITTPMTLDELRASIQRVLGVDIPLEPPNGEPPHLLRRLTNGNTRVAERFRDGRVFLLGDAAHVYTGGGGPGLNMGLQDAVNLGWKLATQRETLLDSYDIERRAAADRTVMYSQAQAALTAPGGEVTALRELFAELMRDPNTVARLAALVAGSDLRYDTDVDDPHPLAGYFAPELRLRTARGEQRLAELMRDGRSRLLDLSADHTLEVEIGGPGYIAAHTADTNATAMLVRPDGYVAWATDDPEPDVTAVREAIARCFGVRHADQEDRNSS